MKKFCLNRNWALKEMPLNVKKEMSESVCADKQGWYTGLNLPFDVHTPLIDNGVIKDPVLSDYSFLSEWIEQRSWWFKKSFSGDEIFNGASVCRLVIESLDVHADIFFNGVYLGHHASAHYPFIYDIKEFIKSDENILLVRMTSGLEYVDDSDLAEIDFAVCVEGERNISRGDKRRAFVRKPTYVYGWDWCPRIATVAIAKNAYIECYDDIAVNKISVNTKEIPNDNSKNAVLEIEAEVELLDIIASADADIEIAVVLDGETKATEKLTDYLLLSGINYISFCVTVPDAQLWYPNGMGSQPLYNISATVTCRNKTASYSPFLYGIRQISIDTSRMNEQNRRFAIKVNGKNIFCKGGNWIPADSIYARVTPEKYDTLVKEAADANFNMLRIWGGGIYERDEFYDACDKYGILVWQDMMFGCSTYPDHIEDFYNLVRYEVDYQTRRLNSRTCIALFCGNNENQWIFRDMKFKQEKQYGIKIANAMMPEYIRKNCSWIPYWNSSPYGGDTPNSPHVGDVHHWGECMMNGDMNKRIEPKEYDKVTGRFVSEYGYPGPCVRESIEKYFDGKEIDRESKVWQLHTNTFEKDTVDAGIKKHYTDKDLDLDGYLLYAGLTQSLMLEYSLESMRYKEFCGGGLFWMYNDCWGEVGWTIIDYYLKRKISFYGVRRTFAPVKLMMREEDGRIKIVSANDTQDNICLKLKYGYISFDGGINDFKIVDVVLSARTREQIIIFDKGDYDVSNGVYYAMPEMAHEKIAPAVLRIADSKNLSLCPPKLSVTNSTNDGKDKIIEILSETYCRGIYIDVPSSYHLSDNYFDMLPGETRKIKIIGGAEQKDIALKCLN